MKILGLVAGFILFTALPALAHTPVVNNTTINQIDEKNIYGAKLDAPNLIKLTDNLYAGSEVSKDLWRTDLDSGWQVMGKITYIGTLFSFKK